MPASQIPNTFTDDGAAALKQMIEAYWRERGANVMVYVQQGDYHAALRTTRFDVRSDMVNGWPRQPRSA